MRVGDGWMGSSSIPICLTDDDFECVACEYYNTSWCWAAPADPSHQEDPEGILSTAAFGRTRNARLPFLFTADADEGSADAAVELLTRVRVPLHLDHILTAISSSMPGRTYRRATVLQALREARGVEEVGERTLVFRVAHLSIDSKEDSTEDADRAVTIKSAGEDLGALAQMLAGLPPASLTREDEIRLARTVELGAAAKELLHTENPRLSLTGELERLLPVSALVARYCDLPKSQPITVRHESPRFRYIVDGAHPAALTELITNELTISPEQTSDLLRRLSILTAIHGAQPSGGENLDDLTALVRDALQARDRMVAHNLRLVVWVARRFGSAGLPWEDLIQEGSIGLLRAIEKFDYRMGNKFSTYAVWWIRQAITRAIANTSRMVRIPAWAFETMTKAGELPDEPVSLDRIVGFFPTAAEELSAPSTGEGSEVEQEVMEEQLASDVQKALEALTDRERRILALRFGLEDGVERTLAEVGEEFHVTRERIRQIEAKALRTLGGQAFHRILASYWDSHAKNPRTTARVEPSVLTRVPINRRPRSMRLLKRMRIAEGNQQPPPAAAAQSPANASASPASIVHPSRVPELLD